MDRVWICNLDGSKFTEHILHPKSRQGDEYVSELNTHPETVCGITYDSLPNIVGYYPAEKNWYYDHERDDVIICDECLDTPIRVLIS